jgi:hypothetical protein
MDSQIEVLTMAADIIHQPLQEFEQSLADEQRAKFSGEASVKSGASGRRDKASLRSCGASATTIDWWIGQIDKSVQPNDQQRSTLARINFASSVTGVSGLTQSTPLCIASLTFMMDLRRGMQLRTLHPCFDYTWLPSPSPRQAYGALTGLEIPDQLRKLSRLRRRDYRHTS